MLLLLLLLHVSLVISLSSIDRNITASSALSCLISALYRTTDACRHAVRNGSGRGRRRGRQLAAPVVRNVLRRSPARSIFPLNHRRTVSGTISPERARLRQLPRFPLAAGLGKHAVHVGDRATLADTRPAGRPRDCRRRPCTTR